MPGGSQNPPLGRDLLVLWNPQVPGKLNLSPPRGQTWASWLPPGALVCILEQKWLPAIVEVRAESEARRGSDLNHGPTASFTAGGFCLTVCLTSGLGFSPALLLRVGEETDPPGCWGCSSSSASWSQPGRGFPVSWALQQCDRELCAEICLSLPCCPRHGRETE